MLRQLAVRDEANIKIAYSAEGRTFQLFADVSLAGIGSNKEQRLAGLAEAESEIQHPHDAGVDGRRVLDFECGGYMAGCGVEPKYVDQPDGVGSRRAFQRLREAFEATVSQMAITVGTVAVVS